MKCIQKLQIIFLSYKASNIRAALSLSVNNTFFNPFNMLPVIAYKTAA